MCFFTIRMFQRVFHHSRVFHLSHLCLALPLAPFTMPLSVQCEEYTLWEMRCPRGRQCGKNNKLINKKTTRALAVTGLASHLLAVHEDITNWNQALRIADDDAYITENTHTYEVPVEPDGSVAKGKGKGEPSMTTIDESIAGMDSLASDCERMARRIRTESGKLQKAKDLIETMSKRPRSPAPPPKMKRARLPSTW